MKRPIYYDTETTGVRSDKDRIIELAAYDPIENRSFCEFINPGMPIPPEATKIHGISDEMVASALSFKEIGQAFAEFCPPNTVLIAHNNESFDKLFIEAEYKRSDLSIPNWIYLDSLKWSRRYRPDLPSHALQNLRITYGIEANNAHRAHHDPAEMIRNIKKYILSTIKELKVIPIETLLEQRYQKFRQIGKFKVE